MVTLKNNTRGFTLIELLVVITIIGILATGATAVYTSQIQKARDTTRINDLEALRGGIEQSYQDTATYPSGFGFSGSVGKYIAKIPKDAKDSSPAASGSCLGYTYMTSSDDNNIEYGVYELSTGFENKGNVDSKGVGDKGSSGPRLEIGIPKNGTMSLITGVRGGTASACSTAFGSTATIADAMNQNVHLNGDAITAVATSAD